jgi:hypothetical protein
MPRQGQGPATIGHQTGHMSKGNMKQAGAKVKDAVKH